VHRRTSGVALAPRHAALRAELADLRATMAQWDEADGDRPPVAAFDDAGAFLGMLPEVRIPPSPYASGDAEVGYRWLFEDGFAEVAFRGDGQLRYAFRFGANLDGGTERFGAGQVNSLPEPLAAALNRL
jgi:hypothetical protein